MNIDSNTDLLSFINSEKKPYFNFNFNKIYIYFSKCFIKTITNVHDKLNSLEKNTKTIHVITSSNVMFHVFWVILNYTKNLNITVFLAERAILLFTEFILMAKNSNISKDLYYIPNVTDAMNFAYKKTIGPINCNNFSNNNIKNNSLCVLKLIIQYLYQHIDLDTTDISILEDYHTYISPSIIKINKILNDNTVFNMLFEKIQQILYTGTVIEQSLLQLKILFELLYEQRHLNMSKINFKVMEYCSIIENYTFSQEVDLTKSYKKHELYKCLQNK